MGSQTSRAIFFSLFNNSNQPLPNTQIQIFKKTDTGEERVGIFTSTPDGKVNIDLPEGQTFIIKDSLGTILTEQQIPNTDGFVIPIIFTDSVPL